MAHQLRHGHGSRHGLKPAVGGPDLEVGELGNVKGDRVFKFPFSLLPQLHHGDPCDRFRHGGDAEDAVRLQGLARVCAGEAVGVEVDNFSSPGRQRGHAGELAGVDQLPEL